MYYFTTTNDRTVDSSAKLLDANPWNFHENMDFLTLDSSLSLGIPKNTPNLRMVWNLNTLRFRFGDCHESFSCDKVIGSQKIPIGTPMIRWNPVKFVCPNMWEGGSFAWVQRNLHVFMASQPTPRNKALLTIGFLNKALLLNPYF